MTTDKHDFFFSPSPRALFKGDNRDDWTLPCANYEYAVAIWKQCCDPKSWPSDEKAADVYRHDLAKDCQKYLGYFNTFENFVLDGRLGMKVQTGLDSINWLAKKKGWA